MIKHGMQRIAFVEHAVENHSDDTIPQLSINRLTVVPFTVHPVFHWALWHAVSSSRSRSAKAEASGLWLTGVGRSSGVIHNYNTCAPASTFFIFLARRSGKRDAA